jgi:hypothetical protein
MFSILVEWMAESEGLGFMFIYYLFSPARFISGFRPLPLSFAMSSFLWYYQGFSLSGCPSTRVRFCARLANKVRLCDIAQKTYLYFFRYFTLDRLSIPIINILGATDYLPI